MLGVEGHFRRFSIKESQILLLVENTFVESLVQRRLYELQRRGHAEPFEAFHQEADALYELPLNRRDAVFRELYATYFERLGFLVPFRETLREFPAFEERIGAIYLAQVAASADESVDLAPLREGKRKREVGIRIRAEQMLDAPRLESYLRHEWTHVDDLLDPDFRAQERLSWGVRSATEEHLLRDRYRVLWCATVDGRLEQRGKPLGIPKDFRRADFERLYRRLPQEARTRAFDRLWNEGRLSHPDLMILAESFEAVRRFAERGVVLPGERTVEPVEGALCPLCRFPTFRWIADVEATVARRIQRDFPQWHSAEGVCERCFERYEMEVMSGWSSEKGE